MFLFCSNFLSFCSIPLSFNEGANSMQEGALRHGGVELLFCSVGLVFKDSGSVPHSSLYVSSCLVPGAAWARWPGASFP